MGVVTPRQTDKWIHITTLTTAMDAHRGWNKCKLQTEQDATMPKNDDKTHSDTYITPSLHLSLYMYIGSRDRVIIIVCRYHFIGMVAYSCIPVD